MRHFLVLIFMEYFQTDIFILIEYGNIDNYFKGKIHQKLSSIFFNIFQAYPLNVILNFFLPFCIVKRFFFTLNKIFIQYLYSFPPNQLLKDQNLLNKLNIFGTKHHFPLLVNPLLLELYFLF